MLLAPEHVARVFEIAVRLFRGEAIVFVGASGGDLVADDRTVREAETGQALMRGDTFEMAYVVAWAEWRRETERPTLAAIKTL
jgi:hypothetical protein